MEIFGWVAAVLGTVLFIASLILTLRANSGTRIPFYRNALVIPAGSIAMRSIGAGLLVFGAVGLASAFGFWSLVIVWGVPLIALVVIQVHNYRLAVTPN